MGCQVLIIVIICIILGHGLDNQHKGDSSRADVKYQLLSRLTGIVL